MKIFWQTYVCYDVCVLLPQNHVDNSSLVTKGTLSSTLVVHQLHWVYYDSFKKNAIAHLSCHAPRDLAWITTVLPPMRESDRTVIC